MVVALALLAAAFAVYLGWFHFRALSPHWTQRDLFWEYYQESTPDEPSLGQLLVRGFGIDFDGSFPADCGRCDRSLHDTGSLRLHSFLATDGPNIFLKNLIHCWEFGHSFLRRGASEAFRIGGDEIPCSGRDTL